MRLIPTTGTSTPRVPDRRSTRGCAQAELVATPAVQAARDFAGIDLAANRDVQVRAPHRNRAEPQAVAPTHEPVRFARTMLARALPRLAFEGEHPALDPRQPDDERALDRRAVHRRRDPNAALRRVDADMQIGHVLDDDIRDDASYRKIEAIDNHAGP